MSSKGAGEHKGFILGEAGSFFQEEGVRCRGKAGVIGRNRRERGREGDETTGAEGELADVRGVGLRRYGC